MRTLKNVQKLNDPRLRDPTEDSKELLEKGLSCFFNGIACSAFTDQEIEITLLNYLRAYREPDHLADLWITDIWRSYESSGKSPASSHFVLEGMNSR